MLSTALTDGSRQLYQRAWAVFRQFYAQFYGLANPSLQLGPNCIPLFISYLLFPKLPFSTITSYLVAISYVHKLRGFPDPTKSFFQRSADVRLPVTRPVLQELIRSLSFTNSLRRCLLWPFMVFSESGNWLPRAHTSRHQWFSLAI